MTREHIKASKRFKVLNRDNFTCQYCGKKSPEAKLEIDHIKPVSKGGDNSMENLVTSCFDCNRGKGSNINFPARTLTFSLSEAAERVNITKDRARYWARLLGLNLSVTEGGIGYLSEKDFQKIKEMSELVESGMSPQSAAARVIATAGQFASIDSTAYENPAMLMKDHRFCLRQELLEILSAMCFAQGHDINYEFMRILRNEFRSPEAQKFFGEGLKNRVDDLYLAMQEDRQEL